MGCGSADCLDKVSCRRVTHLELDRAMTQRARGRMVFAREVVRGGWAREEEVVEEEMLLVCIYMYVCMCVCMCLRVYVCMRSRVHMMRSRIMYKVRYASYVNATYYKYEVVESCFF